MAPATSCRPAPGCSWRTAGRSPGGAHTNHDRAAALLDSALERALAQVWGMEATERLDARYQKFRAMGNIGINES